ncbi:hypothetical protein KO495_13870 [Colwellia sp. D2M02]|uniref:hypothetical protein n=1 Tax=Colwellia sp. D2M02 TaxID=2841562 RepID=UPI001C094A03|nr:hypothetical protein [Colwellia sp. D2M02]MBU2894397.1 hypothetical protein [Colwellia sp. D2M02]
MNNSKKPSKQVLSAIIDFLTESGDTPEQYRTRSERAKVRVRIKAERCQPKENLASKKQGSQKMLVFSYIAFLIPFILVSTQQYYEVKYGNEAAGAGLLLVLFGAYYYFVSIISQKISNFINVIHKVHLVFWAAFALFSLNILLNLNYSHISTDFLVCVGITSVVLAGVKYTHLLLKKECEN